MPRGCPKTGTLRPGESLDVSLTEQERYQIARWLGEFQHPVLIPSLVLEHFGKRLSRYYGYQFLKRQKYQALIDRARLDWMAGTLKVAAANRRYRMERLQQLIDTLDSQQRGGEIPQVKYEQRLRNLLTDARLEMEERKEGGDLFFFTNINSCTDEELLQRREELVKRIQAFQLPLRRVPHGMGRREGGTEAAGPPAEHGGGDGSVGDLPGNGPVEQG